MKRGKKSLYLFNQAAKNSNELSHLYGTLMNDYHDIPADTQVALRVLPNGKLMVHNCESKEGEFYWTSPVKEVTVKKGFIEIITQNSDIRVKTDDFIQTLNFKKCLVDAAVDTLLTAAMNAAMREKKQLA